jgi:hypothetical protein
MIIIAHVKTRAMMTATKALKPIYNAFPILPNILGVR